jgi:hypothetical protein
MMLLALGVTACFGAPALTPTSGNAAGLPSIGGCQVFPADNIWNVRIDTLPVHAMSGAWVNSIGANTGLKADFGSGLWQGEPIGIPFTTAPGGQAAVSIDFYYDDQSDPGPYRIPPDVPIEGGGDHHVLVVDRDRCLLTEVFDATKNSNTSWSAGSGAIFDLGSNALRPSTWTSADAAGLPMLPGLARYDEVAAGEIAHALRFTAPQTQKAFIWPARHQAGSSTNPNLPPMGARFRLKSSVNVSSYPAQIRVILVALQRYGMFLADNGSSWFINGVPDERWNNDTLQQLHAIVGNQLEAVDESSLMVSPDSAQARSGGAPSGTPTLTPTPAGPTSTPTPTPRPSQACAPRPPARVDVARGSAGRLDVTVTAGTGGGTTSNQLHGLRFGTLANATIDVSGQTIAGNARVALPAGSRQARFSVQQTRPGEAVTVPVVVEDDCGDWPTFVGGGRAAF